MSKRLKITVASFFGFIVLISIAAALLSLEKEPESISYGMSFNTPYARELGLDWRKTYDAFLDDLGVRKLRLAAHWDMTEPNPDIFQFQELDYQIKRAEEVGAEVVFAVGERLPRWPECHAPEWTADLSQEDVEEELLVYIRKVVNRYKENESIKYWQVENEPYLAVFAQEHCDNFSESFLEKEIALVKELDPTRPILVTDSGNLGTWHRPYRQGDVFGTSMYLYFWNPELGQFKSAQPAWIYRIKKNLMQLLFVEKPVWLIELSLEPWLVGSVVDTPLATQFERMDEEKFDEIISYARKSRLTPQYLWGGEWWYYLKEVHDDDRLWQKGKKLFESA